MGWIDDARNLIEQIGSAADLCGVSGIEGPDDLTRRMKTRLEYVACYQANGLMPEAYAAPLTLQFELTCRCNLRCAMCYNASGLLARGSRELTDEEWMAVVREGCDLGMLEAVISGGEPLLRRRLLFRILDILKERGVCMHLVTNGWYITPEIARRLGEYSFGFVQVSIDGHVPEVHDAVRQVAGSWARATRALQLLAAQGLPCRLAFTGIKSNYRHVPEVVDLAIALGARTVVLGRALAQGRGNTNGDAVLLDRNEALAFNEIYQQVRAEKGSAIRIIIGMQTAHQLIESHISPSTAGIIRPNGEFRLGCLAPFVYGNVRDRSLGEIWESGAKFGYRHPDVVQYVRDVMALGEREAVSRLNLTPPHESKFIGPNASAGPLGGPAANAVWKAS